MARPSARSIEDDAGIWEGSPLSRIVSFLGRVIRPIAMTMGVLIAIVCFGAVVSMVVEMVVDYFNPPPMTGGWF